MGGLFRVLRTPNLYNNSYLYKLVQNCTSYKLSLYKLYKLVQVLYTLVQLVQLYKSCTSSYKIVRTSLYPSLYKKNCTSVVQGLVQPQASLYNHKQVRRSY